MVYLAPFTFNFITNRILVDVGQFDVDVGGLYGQIKAAQAQEEGIIYGQIAKGSGLVELGPGVQVGITVELLGNWQLLFPEGEYIARVAGGNLVGGPQGDPIAYSAGVQTLLIQSAASTVVNSSAAELQAEVIAEAVWNQPAASNAAPGSFGQLVGKKLLTLAQFLGLK